MLTPRLNSTVLLSPVADGYIAYDTATDQLHRLNAVASLIVELCDGQRTIGQIAESVDPMLPDQDPSIVAQWLDEASKRGLLVDDSTQPSAPKTMSSDQLEQLANRLREHGKIRTAFICQQQAAELEPHNPSRWLNRGELAHIAGLRDEARTSYEHYLTLRPDDAEVKHILVALRNDAPPARVPDECIQQLYERFSSFYDSNLIDELQFAVPQKLSEAIDSVVPGRTDLAILDLGCGTGLSGERLRNRARRLDGIDLSPEMVTEARKRNLYDALNVAEITAWLDAAAQEHSQPSPQRYDLIVACDTLIYFGDLAQVVRPAAALLNDGAAIAFSVERSERAPYVLTDSGRYAHHLDHIEQVAESAGMMLSYHQETFLRMEYGEEVIGHIVVLSAGRRTR